MGKEARNSKRGTAPGPKPTAMLSFRLVGFDSMKAKPFLTNRSDCLAWDEFSGAALTSLALEG